MRITGASSFSYEDKFCDRKTVLEKDDSEKPDRVRFAVSPGPTRGGRRGKLPRGLKIQGALKNTKILQGLGGGLIE